MTNKMKTITVIVVALLVVIAGGVSYAYFTANGTGSESVSTIKVTGGTLNVTMAGGNTINIANAYPRAASWGEKTFTVTGNNTTTMNMYYRINLVVTSNTFQTGSLTYALTGSGTNGTPIANKTNIPITTGATTMKVGVGTFSGKITNSVHTYHMNVYFPRTAADQNGEQTKSMTAHLEIVESNTAS